MSDPEEIKMFNQIRQGLKISDRELATRKAALGQKMVIATPDGKPRTVKSTDILSSLRHKKVSRKRRS